MTQLPQAFNAYLVDPAQPMQMLPISGPEGLPVIIHASEFKAARSGGQNGYLELLLTVIDGPHKGEVGAYRLNLYNDNAQTVDIASRQLSALCHVTKQMQISDSQQLHNIPFRVIVTLQKKKQETDPDYTQVTGVLDINGNKPDKNAGQPAQASAPAFAQQAAPAPAQPAWGQPAQAQAPAFAAQAAPAATGSQPPWAVKQ